MKATIQTRSAIDTMTRLRRLGGQRRSVAHPIWPCVRLAVVDTLIAEEETS